MTTSSSSIRNDNRSDTFTMNKTGQAALVRLRPEKLDDAAIQDQIALIQKACGPIDADLVALIFHECDYHVQNTITRIQAGGVEDGGWQTAKSNNKKKGNQQQQEPTVNGNSQPFRSNNNNYRRQERSYPARRGHPFNANARFPSRQQTKSSPSPLPMQENANESVPSQAISNEQNTPSSSSNDEFEFLAGATQSLTFNNSSKKLSLPLPSTSSTSTTKRPTPSSIPQEPVAMHPTVQFSSAPLDIQFGDVLWNDSIPTAVTDDGTSSNSTEQDKPNDHERTSTFEHERESIDRSSSISSLPMSNTTLTNNVTLPSSLDGTSHLSDHLNDSSSVPITTLSTSATSFPAADSTPAPATSTPHHVEPYPSSSTQPSNLQSHPSLNGNLSAFTPYSATPAVYPSMPRDFSQTKSSWNTSVTPVANAPATAHFKSIPTSNMTPLAAPYPPQASYPIASQAPYVLGPYSYGTTPVYQLITPVEPWASAAGYPSTLESYPAYTNFFPAFPGAQPYHSHTIPTTKYPYSSHDKDMYVSTGPSRSSSNDLSNSSSQQSTKEASSSSKLSATAASFSQAAPLTATSPTGAFYFNPVTYPMTSYIPAYPDRTMAYPSNDSRDNRTGAPYTGQTSRNAYPQQQQQAQGRYNHHQHSAW